MSYTQTDTSVHGASPIELYKFFGATKEYFYTNHQEPVTHLGDVYETAQIGIGDIETTSLSSGNRSNTIRCSADLPFIVANGYAKHEEDFDVVVYRQHVTTDEYEVIWTGQVAGFGTTGNQTSILTNSVLQKVMAASVCQTKVHTTCNHQLYDERCKADPNAHSTTYEVISVELETVGINTLIVEDEWRIGTLTNVRTGEKRLITGNTDELIGVIYPFTDIVVGDDVMATKGCDHNFMSDCLNKFNNQINFGGFVYSPPTIVPKED